MEEIIRLTDRRGRNSVTLDGFRWAAAFAVLFEHVRNLLMADAGEQGHLSILGKVFFLLTSFGHDAVMIFFVLSGFLISSSVTKTIEAGRWNWKSYLISRISRLWVVLIPALVLGLIIDKIGLHYFGTGTVYGTPNFAHIVPEHLASGLRPKVFLGNAFFLQGIFVTTFGSNGPLWSLAYEFWYYISFPFLAIAVLMAKSIKGKILFACLGIGVLAFFGFEIASLFPVWLMGYAVARSASKAKFGSKAAVLVSGGAVILSLILSRMYSLGIASDYLIGATFALLVYCALNRPDYDSNSKLDEIVRFLAGSSYTLYLVHLPLAVFLAAIVLKTSQRLAFSLSSVGVFVLFVILLLGYSVLIWYFTERKTAEFRDFLSNSMKLKQQRVDR